MKRCDKGQNLVNLVYKKYGAPLSFGLRRKKYVEEYSEGNRLALVLVNLQNQ